MIRTDSPTDTSTFLRAFLNSFRAISLSPIVVRRDIGHVDANLLGKHFIDDPILATQPRRALSLPLSAQRLIMESFDEPQTCWARYANNVFPLLVPLQDIDGESGNPPDQSVACWCSAAASRSLGLAYGHV